MASGESIASLGNLHFTTWIYCERFCDLVDMLINLLTRCDGGESCSLLKGAALPVDPYERRCEAPRRLARVNVVTVRLT